MPAQPLSTAPSAPVAGRFADVRPLHRLQRFLRVILVGNALLALAIVASAALFHVYATRSSERFERAIDWSIAYILTPGEMVTAGEIPAKFALPIVQLIERIFIDSVDLSRKRDAHLYWQARLLLPVANTYGRLLESEAQLDRGRRALTIFADLVARHPREINYRRRFARGHQLLAEDLAAHQSNAAALTHYRAALTLADGLLIDEPAHWRWRWYQAMAHRGIGSALASLGQPAAARQAFEAGMIVALGLRAQFPDDSQWTDLLAEVQAARAAAGSQTVAEPGRAAL